MTEISNKTLALLMVAAMVVSLGGLFVSLDRLGKLQAQGSTTTGFISASTSGKANVTISSTATITLTDALINFGTCSPPAFNINTSVITSNSSGASPTAGNCTDGTGDLDNFPDSIRLRNDGNNYLNVTVNTNVTGAEFLGSSLTSTQTLYYATENGTGCMRSTKLCVNATDLGCCDVSDLRTNCSLQRDWTNLSKYLGTADKLVACSNLTFGGGERNFTFWARIDIPYDLVSLGGETKAAINFSADSQ